MNRKHDAFDTTDGDSPIVLTRFRLVRLCALGIMLLLLVFVLGYFWGKMHSISRQHIAHDSKHVFCDHVYSTRRTGYAMDDQVMDD